MKQLYQSVKDQHRVIIHRVDSFDVYFLKANDTAVLHVLEKAKFYKAYQEVKKPKILHKGKIKDMQPDGGAVPIGKNFGCKVDSITNSSTHISGSQSGAAYKAVSLKDVPVPSSVMDVLGVNNATG